MCWKLVMVACVYCCWSCSKTKYLEKMLSWWRDWSQQQFTARNIWPSYHTISSTGELPLSWCFCSVSSVTLLWRLAHFQPDSNFSCFEGSYLFLTKICKINKIFRKLLARLSGWDGSTKDLLILITRYWGLIIKNQCKNNHHHYAAADCKYL